jgi:uncharacterized membrane protein
VLIVLRIIGVFNAVLWLGGALFFTFGVQPGVFSAEMKQVFAPPTSPWREYYLGYIAQQLLERYFTLNLICSLVALGHFFAEMIYAGRRFRRLTFGLLAGVLAFGLVSAYVLTPHMTRLHRDKYLAAPARQITAAAEFRKLHGLSSVGNILALIALVIYTWQVTNPSDPTRFLGTPKFRG